MGYFSSIIIERPSIDSLNGLPSSRSPSNNTFDTNSSASSGFIGIKGEGSRSAVTKYTHKSLPLPSYNNNGKFEYKTMFIIPFIILIFITIIFLRICKIFSHYIDKAVSNSKKNNKR